MKYKLESNRILNGSVHIDDGFWNPKLKTFFEVTPEFCTCKNKKRRKAVVIYSI